MDIANRVFQTAPVEAFATIKDHKPNYQNSLPARLINGTKQNLGRASKRILEDIVTNVRNISKFLYQTHKDNVLTYCCKT